MNTNRLQSDKKCDFTLPPDCAVSHGGTCCTVHNRGLCISDTNRAGKLSFWKLGDLFMRGRVGMVRHPDAFTVDNKTLYEECNLFMVVVYYHVYPSLYRNLENYIESTNLKLETRLISFTRSSLILKTDIIEAETNLVLAQLKFKYVCINRETRKSTVVPQWFVDKYNSQIEPGVTVSYKHVPLPLNNTYSKPYKVIPSDIDWNKHTNNMVYYRLFFDVATEASIKQRLFTLLHGDICNYNVCQSWGVYIKESRMWDNIQVTVWEDVGNAEILHCHICKGDVILFETSVQFYVPTCAKL